MLSLLVGQKVADVTALVVIYDMSIEPISQSGPIWKILYEGYINVVIPFVAPQNKQGVHIYSWSE